MYRNCSVDSVDSVASDCSDYEVCIRAGETCPLPYDPDSLENIILSLCDNFDMKVICGGDRAKNAMLVTSGFALAGSIIGNHYGGKIGAAVGTAVGGACGLGIVAYSMRDIWPSIRPKLSELFEIVYDYLGGLGISDYRKAATILTMGSGSTQELVLIIVQVVSDMLGNRVTSSLTS